MTDKPSIGFIGLGNMGQPMAENLAKAGFDVTGYDVADIAVAGITMTDEPEKAAADKDIVILMLPSDASVRQVTAAILPVMAPHAILIDSSTIQVIVAKQCAGWAKDAGITMLDAPVSGGIAAAAAGSLTFMIGGDETAFAATKAVFEVMGKKLVHCGASGAGQAAKLCNNMILGITMIGTCEAFALADKLDLDRQTLYDVVSSASGQSWSMTSYCPAPDVGPQSPADNDYKPGFAADLMLKDLRLSQIAAELTQTNTEMGRLATELYRRFVEEEDGRGKDFSAMLQRLSSL